MRIPICLVVCLLLAPAAMSQTLTQSASDKSTLLAKGALLSLDIAKTNLCFGANNLHRSVGNNSRPIFGASINAANENGVDQLISNGDFVPSSSLKAYAGWSWSNAVLPNRELQKAALDQRVKGLEKEQLRSLQTRLETVISLHRNALGSVLHTALKEYIEKGAYLEGITTLTVIDDEDNPETERAKKAINDAVAEWRVAFDAAQAVLDAQYEQIYRAEEKRDYLHGFLYVFGGMDAMTFKHYSEVDTVDLSRNFRDEDFLGSRLGIAGNLQWNNLIFGASYSYLSTNNFSLLIPQEFVLSTLSNTGTQTLVQERKIDAYSGDYGRTGISELNIDFAAKFSLDKKSTSHLLLNPYMHAQLASRNSALLPNSTSFGCGFYFFQQTGRFLGGFYVELPDVADNYEKLKPEGQQDLQAPLKRMTFGIVAKFSFRSFAGLF